MRTRTGHPTNTYAPRPPRPEASALCVAVLGLACLATSGCGDPITCELDPRPGLGVEVLGGSDHTRVQITDGVGDTWQCPAASFGGVSEGRYACDVVEAGTFVVTALDGALFATTTVDVDLDETSRCERYDAAPVALLLTSP